METAVGYKLPTADSCRDECSACFPSEAFTKPPRELSWPGKPGIQISKGASPSTNVSQSLKSREEKAARLGSGRGRGKLCTQLVPREGSLLATLHAGILSGEPLLSGTAASNRDACWSACSAAARSSSRSPGQVAAAIPTLSWLSSDSLHAGTGF